jgi:lipid A disaccharide synthetase
MGFVEIVDRVSKVTDRMLKVVNRLSKQERDASLKVDIPFL